MDIFNLDNLEKRQEASTLDGLITSLRTHKGNIDNFISQTITDIRDKELTSPNFSIKCTALEKLTFLQMMGYDISWASFAMVEVMSSHRFGEKRVGCLAASQGLHDPESTPELILTTNLFKKELRGVEVTLTTRKEKMYRVGLALNCISSIVTEELGKELLPDLLDLLKHPSPYVRNKTLGCLYKVFLKYPSGLESNFDKIKTCLGDSNPSVVGCAVTVMNELCQKNPKDYLPLAPAFIELLECKTDTNWRSIKIVKILGSFATEDPTLAAYLLGPLSDIVRGTRARSLSYETVYAITLCLRSIGEADESQPPNIIPEVVELCVKSLQKLISFPDANLKYSGLVGFGSLLQSQPSVLLSNLECRIPIFQCLSNEDVTIRRKALALMKFVATNRNLVDLITQMLTHVDPVKGRYRCDLVEEILQLCSSNNYELVIDFEWYVDILVILMEVKGIESLGESIGKEWMAVASMELPVKSYAVRMSMKVLVSRVPGTEEEDDMAEDRRRVVPKVLPVVASIVGKYSNLIPDDLGNDDGLGLRYDHSSKGPYHSLIQAMTASTGAVPINMLPAITQVVFIQNAMKVYTTACQRNRQTQDDGSNLNNQLGCCSDEELRACVDTLVYNLSVHSESPDEEVKEEASIARTLLLSASAFPDTSGL